MKVKLLCSSVGVDEGHQFLMSYLVDDVLAIDAGSIGMLSPPTLQDKIQDVFLSHAHIDHIASLPIFLDNVYRPSPASPMIYGSRATLSSLRGDFFNDRVWPDLFRLSATETPFLRTQEIESGKTVDVGRYRVTPVELNHVVPTFGFVVSDGEASFAIVSDTSPTDEIWKVTNAAPNLRGCFLEASFPNRMDWLAVKSMHLTPAKFAGEVLKLQVDVPVIAVHIKPAFRASVLAELQSLGLPNLKIGEPGREYTF
ncbi:MAG: 3',5'-cyclic-nucleotide phosphodiesterase [Planctomycetia bacterium]|nr:3',5'-cyclic-nucleotide phosphodiesterase [Planctomycetia bacterium]